MLLLQNKTNAEDMKLRMEDEDVRMERIRLDEFENSAGNVLTLRSLTRMFGGLFMNKNVAVDKITFGIRRGEVREVIDPLG